MTQNRIAVSSTTTFRADLARKMAEEWKLDYIEDPLCDRVKDYTYLLLYTPEYLGLQNTGERKPTPFHIDFFSGKMHFRSQRAGRRNELLARAMGISPNENPFIVDATAGLGRDSFILATVGYRVLMLERSPILYLLLQDALERGKNNPVIDRMSLLHVDAIQWLTSSAGSQKPDIVYLDPMFPIREKSASVKKEMIILQNLLGTDEDCDSLFLAASACATHRVVVKRHRLAPNIAGREPSFSYVGKSSRFDIYQL